MKIRWPDGVVPFYIEPSDFTAAQRDVIIGALREYHRRTCIRFRPYKIGDKNYIIVQGKFAECSSPVGRQYNQPVQFLKLQAPNCIVHEIILHEIMHALGFDHEQMSPSRDKWIKILWKNIEPRQKYNFKKSDSISMKTFNLSYDFKSIMHYEKYAFSKNGYPTMLPKVPKVQFGFAKTLSPKDVIKIEKMYESECEARRKKEIKSSYSDSDLWPL